MTKINVNIITEEYIIKKAKLISNASQVYLNHKYSYLTLNLICINDDLSDFEKDIKFENGLFYINIDVDCIYKKICKPRGHGAYCYLPKELAEKNILIIKSP